MAPTSGYHQLIWDGTFTNQPPEPGVYRIVIAVTGADDRTEGVWRTIRVENPGKEKVMPRTVASGGPAVSTPPFPTARASYSPTTPEQHDRGAGHLRAEANPSQEPSED